MNSGLLIATVSTLVFLVVKIAQNQMGNEKEPTSPKQLVADACAVFLSVFAGDFILGQLGQVDALAGILNIGQAGGTQAKAFTDQPKF
jgi:hypothetical protein